MANPPQTGAGDPQFFQLTPGQQHDYLTATDPDYAGLKPEQQKAYLSHVTQGAGARPPAAGAPSAGGMAVQTKGQMIQGAAGETGREMASVGRAMNPFHGTLSAADEKTRKEVDQTAMDAGKAYTEGELGGAVIGAAAETPMGQRVIKAAQDIPWGRVLKTAGKAAADVDIMKPFKAFSKIGDIWDATSAEAESMAASRAAAKKGLASVIPTSGPRAMGAGAAGETTPSIMSAGKAPGGSPLVPEPSGTAPTRETAFSLPKKDLMGQVKTGTASPLSFDVAKERGIVKPGTIVVPKEAEIATEGPRSRETIGADRRVNSEPYTGEDRRGMPLMGAADLDSAASAPGTHDLGPFTAKDKATIMRDESMPKQKVEGEARDSFHRVVGRNVTVDTPELDKLLEAVGADVKGKVSFLGGGNDHSVFDLGGNKVAKIGYGEIPKVPKIDEVLQPTKQTHVSGPASEARGGVHQSIYPKADTSDITPKDITAMTEKLRAKGYTWDDANGNLGRVNGELKVIDAGGVKPIE